MKMQPNPLNVKARGHLYEMFALCYIQVKVSSLLK